MGDFNNKEKSLPHPTYPKMAPSIISNSIKIRHMKWDECFPEICKSLFRIKAQCSSGIYIGTGFVVAKYKETGKLDFVLATAKHVIKNLPEYEYIHWTIEKFDLRGNKIEEFAFKTNIEETGKSAIRQHKEFDIASIFIPKLIEHQNQALRVINPKVLIEPGARVGWAGFPAFAEKKTIRTHPCYFEGVISTTIDHEGKLFYLVDGHGGKGISGGPLWCWNDEASNYEVIGICSGYIPPTEKGEEEKQDGEEYLPGLVAFESINPLIAYLQTSDELAMTII